jgi:hypothetical protein
MVVRGKGKGKGREEKGRADWGCPEGALPGVV